MAECCVSVRYATAYFHIHIFILFYYEWELEVADRNGRMAISIHFKNTFHYGNDRD